MAEGTSNIVGSFNHLLKLESCNSISWNWTWEIGCYLTPV